MIYMDRYEDPSSLSVEMVERKGIGHPDSLADGIAEEISVSLSKKYIEEFGEILHHNTDKLEIVGGEAEAWFGGGKMERPILVFLSGRASNPEGIDIHKIATDAVRRRLKHALSNYDDSWFEVKSAIGNGSVDLRKNYESLLANDTSFGTGFYPFTTLEQSVFDIEQFVQSMRKDIKPIGEDVKVMGVRVGRAFKYTVAIAFVSKHISDIKEYFSIKEEVAGRIRESGLLPEKSEIAINTADASSPYITNIGTSAESGDDGAVGRGNRSFGLITPMRHMSLEATAGKNPVTHVGKLYNVVSVEIARRVYEETGFPCSVEMVSRIGHPITEPLAVSLRTEATDARRIAEEEIQKLPEMWKDFLKGKYSVF